MRPALAIAIGATLLTAAGCSSMSLVNSREISSDEYMENWPLTVDRGTLMCFSSHAVAFAADDVTYWVNGAAGKVAKDKGWHDLLEIWADDPTAQDEKLSIAPLIDDGLALCKKG